MRPTLCLVLLLLGLPLLAPAALAQESPDPGGVLRSHAFTLFGAPKYGPGFSHFDYVNPEAPKGGSFTYAWGNSYDSLNPFVVVGTAPAFATLEAALFEHLMVRSGDEPSALYGLVAESIAVPQDYTWVEFRLRKEARWHDGKPLTADDVAFSMEVLKAKGSPQYRNDYAGVASVQVPAVDRVRFTLGANGSRALVYAIAAMPVLPRHWWEGRDFSRPMIEAPLGSGPYRLANVDAGRGYTLERVKDYWARDLPVNRGRWNFDRIQHDYYRDVAISFEAFKAGKADLRWETLPAQWATGYDVPARADGRLQTKLMPFEGTTFYAGFYFNQRRALFTDARLREAIGLAFDFDWLNKTVFHDEFVRLRSFFDNTELANQGLPEGAELALLEPFRGQLDPRVFTEAWNPPSTGATEQGLRDNLRKASQLLREAGWTPRDGRLVNAQGTPLRFELLTWDPFFQRVAAPLAANLKRLGVEVNLRQVDTTEWFRRIENYDFDLTQGFSLPQSLAPGPEQREFFGSKVADQPGSRNLMGIRDPVVDALIEKLVAAPDRAALVAATHALDRVLCWRFYSIPHGYMRGVPVAWWNRFGRPEKEANWLRLFWLADTWWVDPEREAALARAGGMKSN